MSEPENNKSCDLGYLAQTLRFLRTLDLEVVAEYLSQPSCTAEYRSERCPCGTDAEWQKMRESQKDKASNPGTRETVSEQPMPADAGARLAAWREVGRWARKEEDKLRNYSQTLETEYKRTMLADHYMRSTIAKARAETLRDVVTWAHEREDEAERAAHGLPPKDRPATTSQVEASHLTDAEKMVLDKAEGALRRGLPPKPVPGPEEIERLRAAWITLAVRAGDAALEAAAALAVLLQAKGIQAPALAEARARLEAKRRVGSQPGASPSAENQPSGA